MSRATKTPTTRKQNRPAIYIGPENPALKAFADRVFEAIKDPRKLSELNAELAADDGRCVILEADGSFTISDLEWEAARAQGRIEVIDSENGRNEIMHDEPVEPTVLQ